ncbi:hypothetical protein CRG98_029784 [Punica granatum]|uniref:Uncharacterized protein n=1 Tax=Punica granatum TaxID=22663 RepID=A0A2I0J0M8_PUNGR|nr:hypothetical protein CRG98_029784 [Punica granatum]
MGWFGWLGTVARRRHELPQLPRDCWTWLGGAERSCPFLSLVRVMRAVLLMSACLMLWAEPLTRRPRLEIANWRHPRNPRTRLSQCFSSVLMCSETIAISICQKQVPKVCREAFVTIETSLGRPAYFRMPFICPWSGHPGSPVRKASAKVRGCPGLSRKFLKCAQRCYWSFWY